MVEVRSFVSHVEEPYNSFCREVERIVPEYASHQCRQDKNLETCNLRGAIKSFSCHTAVLLGHIPKELGALNKLLPVDLNDNQLTGKERVSTVNFTVVEDVSIPTVCRIFSQHIF